MDKILEPLKTFFNNPNYVTAIGIVITALSAYHIAKINVVYPNKLQIQQKQLENVYLPLHRLLNQLPSQATKDSTLNFQKNLDVILEENYQYAFPQLHQLSRQLQDAIIENNNYSKILIDISHQVSVEYELLKRKLGYPSQRIFSIFIRMTPKKKFEFILGYLNVIWLPFLFFLVALNMTDKTGNIFLVYVLILLSLNILYSRH